MISSNKINKFLDYLNSNNSLDNSKYLTTDCLFHMFIRDVDLFFFHNSRKENLIKENIVVNKSICLGAAFRRYYRQNLKNVR